MGSGDRRKRPENDHCDVQVRILRLAFRSPPPGGDFGFSDDSGRGVRLSGRIQLPWSPSRIRIGQAREHAYGDAQRCSGGASATARTARTVGVKTDSFARNFASRAVTLISIRQGNPLEIGVPRYLVNQELRTAPDSGSNSAAFAQRNPMSLPSRHSIPV